MSTDKLADALPELPKAIFWARNIDGRLELRAGEKPPNRAGGYASPWAAMYDGPSVRDYALQALAAHDAQPAPAPVQGDSYRDAYEGAREDLLDWKGRAQRAEATLRSLGYTGIDASHPPTPAADGAGELAAKPSECANGCPPQQVCDYCQKAGITWRERWEGSGPQRGWHIVESTRLHNNAHVAYLGESPTSEAMTAIVMAHNAAIAALQQKVTLPALPEVTDEDMAAAWDVLLITRQPIDSCACDGDMRAVLESYRARLMAKAVPNG